MVIDALESKAKEKMKEKSPDRTASVENLQNRDSIPDKLNELPGIEDIILITEKSKSAAANGDEISDDIAVVEETTPPIIENVAVQDDGESDTLLKSSQSKKDETITDTTKDMKGLSLNEINNSNITKDDKSKSGNSDVSIYLNSNPNIFQWSSFHSFGSTSIEVSESRTCMSWLTTKESFFLTYVEMFVYHVHRVSTKPVKWNLIPSYDVLLECFWPLLRSAIWWDSVCTRVIGQGQGWVTSFPGYMRVKRTACALMSNNKSLINPYIRMTFECSNIYSLLSVDSCIEHLNLWFNVASNNPLTNPLLKPQTNNNNNPNNVGRNPLPPVKGAQNQEITICLPDEFDYDVFWPYFSILLDSDSFQVLLKTISLLYNNFHLFKGKVRSRLVNDLLQKYFFRLFLHWSSEVRVYFQHLVVYKILRTDRRYLPCFTDTNVLMKFASTDSEDALSAKNVSQAGINRNMQINKQQQQQSAKGNQSSFVQSFSLGKKGGNDISIEQPPNKTSATASTASTPLATLSEILALTGGGKSSQQRLSLLEQRSIVDDEETLNDMANCSKIDTYIRYCLAVIDPGDDKSIIACVPEECRAYTKPAMIQYASLLLKYYRGVQNEKAFLDGLFPTLNHRMVLADTNPYT